MVPEEDHPSRVLLVPLQARKRLQGREERHGLSVWRCTVRGVLYPGSRRSSFPFDAGLATNECVEQCNRQGHGTLWCCLFSMTRRLFFFCWCGPSRHSSDGKKRDLQTCLPGTFPAPRSWPYRSSSHLVEHSLVPFQELTRNGRSERTSFWCSACGYIRLDPIGARYEYHRKVRN